jgi:NAD(P)-dependent dehydrogenase (short-subunit alcohol dehydrogenase family)
MFVPVLDHTQQPLMPTTPSRARRWIKNGKATAFLAWWSLLCPPQPGTVRARDPAHRCGDRSLAVPVDLRDAHVISQLVAAVHDHFGHIDVLINNAGQSMHGFLEYVEVAQYRLLMDLNLYAPLLTMQAVIPYMRQQGGGMILNISAPLRQMPVLPSLGAYAASKAALMIMTLTARAELAADHIRVGLLYPGMMATEMNAHLLPASTTQPVPVAWEAGGALPAGAPQREAPEVVARSVLVAIQREEAEYYTEGFRQLVAWMQGMSSAEA